MARRGRRPLPGTGTQPVPTAAPPPLLFPEKSEALQKTTFFLKNFLDRS